MELHKPVIFSFCCASRSSCSLCVSLSSLIVSESMLSSANSLKVLCLIYSCMYAKKRIGPSRVPCGTQEVTCIFSDLSPSNMTVCVPSVRKTSIQFRVLVSAP
jgi:hypothetical protein